MRRVKCAHCGAGNHNVTETDTCFQCGNVLGSKPQTRHYASYAEAAPTRSIADVMAEIQRNSGAVARKTGNQKDASLRTLAIAAASLVFILTFGITLILMSVIR